MTLGPFAKSLLPESLTKQRKESMSDKVDESVIERMEQSRDQLEEMVKYHQQEVSIHKKHVDEHMKAISEKAKKVIEWEKAINKLKRLAVEQE